ncbi:MAG TPA: L,D-transpeptidase family protein [Sphingomonadaceae bacterium]
MNPAVKWIGGASLGAALFFAAAFAAGSVLEAQDNAKAPVADSELAIADTVKADAAQAEQPALQTAPTTQSAAAATPAAEPAAKADEPFVIKRILPIDGPIKYGEWHWDDKGVPAGPLVITVDLDARVLSVFRDGYEIGATAVLLGTQEHPTPTGRFPILSKERHNVSEKYNDAPMPWTLRLTSDGVAIHGGHAVELGYASHGCISTPDAFQAKLFAIAHKGDVVIITSNKRTGIGQSLVG